ncbi:serine protease inhibitor serpin [Holotrichia oblita]|uniref:Serine protease inhibitor serpin n=1 Tax=Holotrichia oblita TaxID=644536 RepID=A0ACB9T712_HOLOL|nr:serine protease inhibitor serpin [Holotrichia oblita]
MAETPIEYVSNANAVFSKNLFNIIAEKGKNIIYSPLSAHAILSLVHQGAADETAESMEQGLHLSDTKLAATGYQSVMEKLNSVNEVTLHIANKVYIHEKYNLKDEFCTTAKECYLSETEKIAFTPDTTVAAKTMNDWVENQTNNKIQNLIHPSNVNCDTRLFLINAIYFKGKWLDCFSEKWTKKEKFYLNDNDTVDCDMMQMENKFRYGEDDDLDAQIINIPYKDENLSLMIILPRSKTGIPLLEEKIATKNLTDININLVSETVILFLPKFKIESTIELNEPLTEMGMEIIFSNRAKFSNLIYSPEPLAISSVIQKAFIEVNEEGVEAAAATAGTFTFLSAYRRMEGYVFCVKKVKCSRKLKKPPKPKIFRADHGFLFYLYYQDEHNIHLIFVGKLERFDD